VAQELDVKLVEIGLHDPEAGVGKVKGFDLHVGSAAKLVGKKVRVRVTAVMDGVAYAEQVSAAGESELPITAEAEAERPTRAPRRTGSTKVIEEPEGEDGEETPAAEEPASRKPARTRTTAKSKAKHKEADASGTTIEPGPDVEGEPTPKSPRKRKRKPTEPQVVAPIEDEAAESVAEEPPTESMEDEEPASKKRTRRGSRGGRGRKRKTAMADEPETPSELAVTPDIQSGDEKDEPSAPVIHVPDRDLGEEGPEPSTNGADPVPPKKRTRRGSRGGRHRKRKPAAAVAAGTPGDEAAGVDGQPASGDWQYTPMSEWGSLDERPD
jgi:hypothetical protein